MRFSEKLKTVDDKKTNYDINKKLETCNKLLQNTGKTKFILQN